jgi:hypothetical protein
MSGRVTASHALEEAMRLRTSLTLWVAMRIADYDGFELRAAASATSCVTVSQVR